MPTIAELQLNLDARPVERGVQVLNDFATAADKAARAGKGFSDSNNGGGGLAPQTETKKVRDLTEAIDAQTRKLNNLAEQRRQLNASETKNTMPAEYERLNRIIDANISKVMQQGNAIDQLNTKRGTAFLKAEQQSDAELRARERVAAGVIRQENVLSRAAASQQRQIDSTINGLSRQIAAQNEYNRTIETLNRARVVSSMNGSPDALSGAEYESYVQLARARRDAALATEDNSRATDRAQSRLETYRATLGRVERAEVEYARAVGVLNEAQRLGLVTLSQYESDLASFTNKRDAAVRAANDNTAAEQRFARELQGVVSAYNPLIRAQNDYNNNVKILSQGLQSGALTVEQFNKSLTDQRNALEGVKNAQSGLRDLGTEYQSALNNLVPYRAELRNLEQQERTLKQAKDSGKVSTQAEIEEYNRATDAIKRNRAEIERRTDASRRSGNSAKQDAQALRQVPAQITDIVVSLQGGQAPLTVLLQQGGQLKDVFGGVGPAIKGLATGLVSLITPATILASTVALLAYSANEGSKEVTAFNRALIQSGGASGVSASQFSQYRDQLDGTITTSTKAAAALTLIAGTGKIASDQFVQIAESAIQFEKATGQAIEETVKDFASLGKEPVEAAVRLDEKYKFLTASVLAQADALVRQGKEQEAVILLQESLSSAATDTANRMIQEAGYIERAWTGVKNIVSETLDALKSIGREDTTASRLADLQTRRELLLKRSNFTSANGGNTNGVADKQLAAIDKEIAQLKQRNQYEDYSADLDRKREIERRDAVSAEAASQRRYISGLDSVAKAEQNILDVRRENARILAAGDVSEEQKARLKANEAKAIADRDKAKEEAAKKLNPRGALDTTSVQEVRGNLSIIAAEYDGYYKRVTEIGKAGVVSEEATYQSQRAILEAQRAAVSKSYDEQISAIKNLQDNKKNSNAQNISLDNQLTRAEAAKVVELEKLSTRLDTLKTKEGTRLADRTRNISAFRDALESQKDGLIDEGARNADGVGRGGRQANIDKQIGSLDRSFARQETQLANQLNEGLDPIEYAEKLRLLRDAHSDMTKQILVNDRQIQEANADWTNGFTSAVEDAQDAGLNFAGSVNQALTGAFNSAGDALATFVTTGKLSFSDFTRSVLSDMARIAAQQAASGALGGILGLVGSAASAYFGGGANGFAAGSAAAGSSAAGASQAGYNNLKFQAQGGAWSGGTQLFAQGGAFTNSIVSSPTSFGMANGARGIMGEAGDEAVVPLARTRNGDLGIRAMGGGGGGGTVINVSVQVASDGGSSTKTNGGASFEKFGNELGGYVRKEVYTILNNETRPGGSLQAQR